MKQMAALSISLVMLLGALVIMNNSIPAADYESAPDFKLTDLDGKKITLADYEGKVLFVNFWATWCPPCRQEIPGFIKLYEKYKDDGLVILGVAVSDKEKTVKAYVDRFEINYPVAMGDMKIIRDYEPGNAIPATIIVDRTGKIYHKHVGYMEQSQVEKIFKDLSK
jgi:peroxiredoxin